MVTHIPKNGQLSFFISEIISYMNEKFYQVRIDIYELSNQGALNFVCEKN